MATQLVRYYFDGGNTSTGIAGNTTSVPPLIDVAGSTWKVLNGDAVNANSHSANATILQAPASYNVRDGLISDVVPFDMDRGQRMCLRIQANGDHYMAFCQSGHIYIFRQTGGNSFTTLVNVGTSLVNGTRYRMSFAANGASPTTLTLRIAAEATPNTVLVSATITDSTAGYQVSGAFGIDTEQYDTGPCKFSELTLYDFTDNTWPTFTTAAVASATATYGSTTPTTVTITCTGASGGTGALTSQWHKSQTADFTPGVGTAISAQTSQNLTAYAAAAGMWYYKRVDTDTLSITGASNHVPAQIQDGTLVTPVLGFIGDSLWSNPPSDSTGTLTVPAVTGILLGLWAGFDKAVTLSNRAIGGTTTQNWADSINSGYLADAIAAMQSAGCTHCSIMLGTNDSAPAFNVTANQYSTNMAIIAGAVVTGGMKAILHYPTFTKNGSGGTYTETAVGLLQAYQAKIDALCNGSTILQGDKLGWREFSKHAELDAVLETWYTSTTAAGDWCHPNGRGVYAMAYMQARAIAALLDTSGLVAAQLATDMAAVDAGKGDIKTTRTILGVTGTFNMPADEAAAAAAQLATDVAAVTAKQNKIKTGQTILGVSGTLPGGDGFAAGIAVGQVLAGK